MFVGLHVKFLLFLSDFNKKIELLREIFKKIILKYEFNESQSVGKQVVLWGRRTDKHNEVNTSTPNDNYGGRTAALTSKRCILYIYSTNIDTEYYKHCMYSPCFPLQNAVCFIILTYLVPVLFKFYVQNMPKFKKNNSGSKRLVICFRNFAKASESTIQLQEKPQLEAYWKQISGGNSWSQNYEVTEFSNHHHTSL